ncbi:molecular chaperone HtpG, partial [Salmonella sp. gx-f8]|nr:molecular chaperone HtpG [Salmonella sp. gx-f8]
VSAENWTAAKSGPHLEVFRKKGVEVLLLTDRVDEWMLSFLHDFEEKALVSVARGGLDLGSLEDEAERAEHAKVEGEFKPLVDRAKAVLADKAK